MTKGARDGILAQPKAIEKVFQPDGDFDVHQYIALCRAHYDKVGLGAGLIEGLFR